MRARKDGPLVSFPKVRTLFLTGIWLLLVSFNSVELTSGQFIQLSDDPLVSKEEIKLFDDHFFAMRDSKYKSASKSFDDGEAQSWGLHQWVSSMAIMYEATHNIKYLRELDRLNFLIWDKRDHRFNPPREDQVRRKTLKAWSETYKGGPRRVELHIIGQYAELLGCFARIVSENPALQPEFGPHAILFTIAALEAIEEWSEYLKEYPPMGQRDLYYIIPPIKYLFSVGLDFADELDAGQVSANLREQFPDDETLTPDARVKVEKAGSKWTIIDVDRMYLIKNENQTLNVYRSELCTGKPEPYNIQNIMFRAMLELAPVLNSDFFQNSNAADHKLVVKYQRELPLIISGSFRYFKEDRQTRRDNNIEWYYWGRYPRSEEKTACASGPDDFNHGAETIYYVVKLWKNLHNINSLLEKSGHSYRIDLSEQDLERFANTFLYKIASKHPVFFSENIDGSGHLYCENHPNFTLSDATSGWIQLALFDRRVFDEAVEATLWVNGAGKQPLVTSYNYSRILELKNMIGNNIHVSYGGSGFWKPMNSVSSSVENTVHVLAGDFDGDGMDDLLKAEQAPSPGWYVSWSGSSPWMFLISSDRKIDELLLGDFDANGTTDIFQKSGPDWKVLFGKKGSRDPLDFFYRVIRNSNRSFENYRFGDFDGDGTTDIFYRTNSYDWEVSFGNKHGGKHSRWKFIGSPGEPSELLGFGDFDGNGVTDIFRAITREEEWQVSFGEKGQNDHGLWEKVGTSSYSVEDIRFADMDGDGITDIFSKNSLGQWVVSRGTSARQFESWYATNTLNGKPQDYGFANFDGDNRMDVYRIFSGGSPIAPVQSAWEGCWGGSEAISSLGNQLYIVQNKNLHRLDPGNGHYMLLRDQGGDKDMWGGTEAMVALNDTLYIVQNRRLHRVDRNGHWEVLPDQNGDEAVWGGTEAMSALNDTLYIVQNRRLHRVDRNGHWEVLPDQNGDEAVWGGTEAMSALNDTLYIVQNRRLHRVDRNGHWKVLPDQNGDEAVWGGTEAMSALNDTLYIIQNRRLHRVDRNGHWKVLPDQNGDEAVWGGTEAMSALGNQLYIVKNRWLHRVERNGHFTVLGR